MTILNEYNVLYFIIEYFELIVLDLNIKNYYSCYEQFIILQRSATALLQQNKKYTNYYNSLKTTGNLIITL